MKKLTLFILTSAFILTSCGGGGGGDSAPAPIYPSVSFSSGLSVDGGTAITVTPNISDPQSRITSRQWELSTSGGKEFGYSTTNTSVTFTAPKNQTDQTVTITFSYTYRLDGTTVTTGSGTATGQVTMKAVIPDTPANFAGNGLSQSANFSWDVSDGTASYYVYYSSDNSVTTSDPFVEIEGEDSSSTFLVRIPNDITEYWAISAVNSAGESQLSSSIEITTKSPDVEFTNQPNTGSFDLTKVDEWGNELDDSANDWSCVKDNVTGLMWEVKLDANRTFGDDGLRDLDDRFAYYDSTNVINGSNDFGDKNQSGTDCIFAIDNSDYNCNTEDFFKALNSKPAGEHFCGRADWRLPSVKEFIQLLDLTEASPNFPDSYFDGTNNINGAEETYWTSNQVDEPAPSDQFAVTFNRDNGITEYKSKTEELHIVSVVGEDNETNLTPDFIVECTEWDVSDGGWRPYEYTIEEANEFAINKANQTGEDWRLSTLKELAHYVDDLPKDSVLLSATESGDGQVYDNWVLKVVENPSTGEVKGQRRIFDLWYGTYNICLSKY